MLYRKMQSSTPTRPLTGWFEKVIEMDEKRLFDLLTEKLVFRVVEGLDLGDVLKLIKKANPKWEKVNDINPDMRGPAPAYACQITLPGDITLDVITTGYSEISSCLDTEIVRDSLGLDWWQLTVVRDSEIMANYIGGGRKAEPRKLFERVHAKYSAQPKQQPPSADQVRAAVKGYLSK